jgi:hypothetical protein
MLASPRPAACGTHDQDRGRFWITTLASATVSDPRSMTSVATTSSLETLDDSGNQPKLTSLVKDVHLGGCAT